MHGRLKVKSTAEQQEAKRKEREKKLQIYNAATSKIFLKKRQGELDEELLSITGEVLAVNPDFYTLWNFRKEAFLEIKKYKETEELQKMFSSELYFLESCLKMNPKSYGTWHHRCFVMETMPEPDWPRELELCNTFLKYDERNFHCWDYRRFVVKKSGVSPEAEFEFSMGKISNNFSNYSSWHYRSKLLPVLFPDPSQPMGVTEEALLKEYELVQNGFFTDPDDQSNWFYHRWLMGRGDQKQTIHTLAVDRSQGKVLVSLAKHIKIGKSTELCLECNRTPIQGGPWRNHLNTDSFSTLWISEGLDLPLECDLRVSLTESGKVVCTTSLHLTPGETYRTVCGQTHSFSQELSAVKNETLQLELESISQLMEIETDNKWATLTVVLLMQALNPVKHQTEIMNNIDKLIALDLKRANYYRDLRSKFLVEDILTKEDLTSPLSSLTLKGRKLTKLYHPELLPLLRHMDVSENELREVNHFSYLQSVLTLDLSDNQIGSCEGLENLAALKVVNLRKNKLSSPEDLRSLENCPQLTTLDISCNPVCDTALDIEGVREMLPHVKVITDTS